jgi:hypothetical protein
MKTIWGIECTQNEAQFKGLVSETRIEEYDQGVADCYVRIQFSDYKPSAICPLDEMQALTNEVYITSGYCGGLYKVGDGISGYLVQDQSGRIYLDLK